MVFEQHEDCTVVELLKQDCFALSEYCRVFKTDLLDFEVYVGDNGYSGLRYTFGFQINKSIGGLTMNSVSEGIEQALR